MHDIVAELAEEVHASAALDLVAASFLWRCRPRLARRYLERAADQLRALPASGRR